jgi:DNA-damage-inducible protein D
MAESRVTLPTLLSFIRSGAVMTEEIAVFHFEDSKPNFESLCKENGFKYWLASDLMKALGYTHMQPVLKAVNHAQVACAHIDAPIGENFIETKTEQGGKDWKLSRFACYLTVMNGDPKNPRVAEAQAYFVTIAEAFRHVAQEADNVERVLIRGEMSEREKALSATAHVHGVENYPFFQNAGYRGLYNMDLKDIRRRKGVPEGRSPLDFMGKTELAANLFRITQTDDKIRNEDISGQRPLERAAEQVGKTVRQTIREIGGTMPEQLPPAQDIKQVRSGLKKVGREYAKLDGKKKD